MALKDNLQHIFNSDYPGTDTFINEVLVPMFGDDLERKTNDFAEDENYHERAAKVGLKKIIYAADIIDEEYRANKIAFFDVTVDNNVNIERARVNIQQVIRSIVDYHSHILIVFHYEDVEDKPWRFSYAYKQGSIANSTSAKRYTYVFGRDFRGRTAAERFEAFKKSDHSNKALEEAFSVEALSDEFFDIYRAYYATFVEYITGEKYSDEKKLKNIMKGWKWRTKDTSDQFSTTFDRDAKATRDYIKKMFGRIVFLYFLQRKGWLYDNEGRSDAQYMKHLFDNAGALQATFLDDVLEILFFYVLNTKPESRISEARMAHKDVTILPGWDKIPFLNGGLFEQDDIDPKKCTFPAEYFREFFNFLNSYNFTIDENDQEDAEIGIDPEMLGRIFENLLEDNKDKGAFYTPKPIVDYMCRESIIAYLQDKDIVSKETIRFFVENLERNDEIYRNRLEIKEALKAVKICDPAIGSGAFPMGLVNLLAKLYLILGVNSSELPTIKRHIMHQNIYGVDIEKGAVDIARLRFWLAMVVDETEPQPLPNLHFKIMQGNSLLESFNGIDLSDLTLSTERAKELSTGKLDLFNEKTKQLVLFDSEDTERISLVNSLKKYYNTVNHQERDRLFNEIVANVRRQLFEKGIILPTGEDPSANIDFFLWHTWFTDVFEKGGFDIVIGNPPYIQLQKAIGIKGIDKKGRELDVKLGDLYKGVGFETFAKTGDIYGLFYEQGIKMLKPNGHLCYITSNKWMRASYGESLRDFFSKKTNPILLIDFAGIQIFENATVDTNILLLAKAKNQNSTLAYAGSNKDKSILNNLSDFVRQNGTQLSFSSSESWVILTPIEESIKRKIETVGKPLKDWDIQINYGIKTGFNDAFVITTVTREQILSNCADEDERKRTAELIRPILRGRDIKKYSYDWADLWLINTHNGIKGKLERIHIEDYPAVKAHLDQYWDKISNRVDKGDTPYNLRNCAYLDDFNNQKIVWARLMRLTKRDINDFPRFALVPEGIMTVDSLCFFSGNEIEKICTLLNSEYAAFYFLQNIVALDNGGLQMRQQYIEDIPLPLINEVSDDEIYNFFGLVKEEISFIKHFVRTRKEEILERHN